MNYGGTLFLLCAVSPPKAKIISLDPLRGPFGGGYPDQPESQCEVARFWNEIKTKYAHQEFIEGLNHGSPPVAITGAAMETAGLGVLFIP